MGTPESDAHEEEQEDLDRMNDEDDEEERLNREKDDEDEEDEAPYTDDM
jgi:hypothetical protein